MTTFNFKKQNIDESNLKDYLAQVSTDTTEIDLSDNQLTDACIDQLLEYMKKSTNIKRIILTNNQFTLEGRLKLSSPASSPSSSSSSAPFPKALENFGTPIGAMAGLAVMTGAVLVGAVMGLGAIAACGLPALTTVALFVGALFLSVALLYSTMMLGLYIGGIIGGAIGFGLKALFSCISDEMKDYGNPHVSMMSMR